MHDVVRFRERNSGEGRSSLVRRQRPQPKRATSETRRKTEQLLLKNQLLRKDYESLTREIYWLVEDTYGLIRRTAGVTDKSRPVVDDALQGRSPISSKTGVLDNLTPREKDVLRSIAKGKSTKQIAFELGISFKTAVSHRTNLMAKLEIHDVATLTRLAIRCGLIRD